MNCASCGQEWHGLSHNCGTAIMTKDDARRLTRYREALADIAIQPRCEGDCDCAMECITDAAREALRD